MKKSSLLTLSLLLSSLALVSCGNSAETNVLNVDFYLEGASVSASSTNIKVRYQYTLENEEDLTYIADPSSLPSVTLTYADHILEGWYKTREVAGQDDEGNPIYTYTDKFDFQTEKIGLSNAVQEEGDSDSAFKLYAHWISAVKLTYSVRYTDEATNDEIVLGTYSVNEGEVFDDYRRYSTGRVGYTFIDFYQDKELTTVWDESYQHPGGENDLDIPVYVKYFEGDYTVVNTRQQLNNAGNNNIYLNADIDLGGRTFFIRNYTSNFVGNNHTISNFNVGFDTSAGGEIFVGIFGTLSGATVEDVTFDDYTININTGSTRISSLLIGPLAGNIVDSTINNVTVSNIDLSISANTTRPVYYALDRLGYIESDSAMENNTIENANMTDNREESQAVSLFKADLSELNKRKFERRLK